MWFGNRESLYNGKIAHSLNFLKMFTNYWELER